MVASSAHSLHLVAWPESSTRMQSAFQKRGEHPSATKKDLHMEVYMCYVLFAYFICNERDASAFFLSFFFGPASSFLICFPLAWVLAALQDLPLPSCGAIRTPSLLSSFRALALLQMKDQETWVPEWATLVGFVHQMPCILATDFMVCSAPCWFEPEMRESAHCPVCSEETWELESAKTWCSSYFWIGVWDFQKGPFYLLFEFIKMEPSSFLFGVLNGGTTQIQLLFQDTGVRL